MDFLLSYSSGIVKRLLLFSLARFDILDKDPAEFVEVSVGKKSTLELRDVGLRIERLTSLLHLETSPELRLTHARVAILRLILTLDLKNPSLLVEVDGIRLNATLNPGNKIATSGGGSSSSDRAYTSKRELHTQDAGSREDIPSAEDLAKSFLQEEPARERQGLEEAFNSNSRYIHESMSSDDDNDPEVGMGTALSLPGFLTRFIEAALDRCEVAITDIGIKLDAEIPPSEKASEADREPIDVALNFWIESAAIHGLSSATPVVEIPEQGNDPLSERRSGQRKLFIRNIGAEIISSPDLFESLSRPSRSLSPLDTRSNTSSHEPETTEPVASPPSATSLKASEISNRSHNSPDASYSPPRSLKIHDHPVELREPALSGSPEPLEDSRITTDDDRFADATSEDGLDSPSYEDESGTSRHIPVSPIPFHHEENESMFQDRSFLEYAMNNGMWDSSIDENSSEMPSLLDKSVGSVHSQDLPPGDLDLSPQDHVDNSSIALNSPLASLEDADSLPQDVPEIDNKAHALDVNKNTASQGELPDMDSHLHPEVEDLTQSRLYDHEDAESMYMSAYSEAPESHNLAIPGGWEPSGSSSAGQTTIIEPKEDQLMPQDPEPEGGLNTPRPSSPADLLHPNLLSSRHESTPNQSQNMSCQGDGKVPGYLEGRVSKSLLSIDHLSIWFPWPLLPSGSKDNTAEADLPSNPTSLFDSTTFGEDTHHQDIPGAFSMYAETRAGSKRTSSSAPSSKQQNPDVGSKLPDPSPRADRVTSSPSQFDFEVGSVNAQIDLTTGKLLFEVFQHLQKILSAGKTNVTSTLQKQGHDDVPKPGTGTALNISMQSFSLRWQESIAPLKFSHAHSLARGQDGSASLDTILRLGISVVKCQISNPAEGPKFSLGLGHLAFGLANENIVSFDNSARMRTSVRDLREPLQSEVSVEYKNEGGRSVLNIATLPICINFDAQKLDEAFNSFGGFSGMLELGNSVSSNSTIHPRKLPPSRPRGVHFEAPPATSNQNTSSKINARIGGAKLILKGKSCALQARTSAIKIVSRSVGVQVRIDKTRITGPLLIPIEEEDAPHLASFDGTRIEFLNNPEETDLTRLLSLLTPSRGKYEDDDDILVDALLRQRKKGSVLRFTIDSASSVIRKVSELQLLGSLGEELSKLSTVAKYLPEDDRPGILTLGHVKSFDARVALDDNIGIIHLLIDGARVAHVGWPSLLALEIAKISGSRGEELLIHEVTRLGPLNDLPMLMARKVGDEVEPTVKLKLYNLCVEYRVSTVMALLGLSTDASSEELVTGIADSVATITGPPSPEATLSRQSSAATASPGSGNKHIKIDVLLRDCTLGLNPRDVPSKALVVLTETRFTAIPPRKGLASASLELRTAALFLIDDVSRLNKPLEVDDKPVPGSSSYENEQVTALTKLGYVSVGTISSAFATARIERPGSGNSQVVNVDFKNDLFLLQTCADSTQTLFTLLGGLSPPSPPSQEARYRTQVVPMEDMMASFTGDVYAPVHEQEEPIERSIMDDADTIDDELPTNLEFVGSFYNPGSLPTEEDLGDELLENDLLEFAKPVSSRKLGESTLLESFEERYEVDPNRKELIIRNSYFSIDDEFQGIAHKWNSERKEYEQENEFMNSSPLKVRIRDVQFIWHLFDGYDWLATRDKFTEAVQKIEQRAEDRRQRQADDEDDDVSVEEDFLFNSVWITVPVADEKGTLTKKINREIDDLVSETGSYATSTTSRSTVPARPGKTRQRGLRLERSKRYKISIELSGVSTDFVVYPPGTGESQSSVDLRIRDFEIIDRMPQSNWNKFLTYMWDAGEREMERPQVHIKVVNVRPIPTLAASELVITVSILPLRLHVDQDALDFITRFFEFKDESAIPSEDKSEQPFIQKLAIETVQLSLDYKPKKVDYRGLRSGRTKEFMNFITLDEAPIILKRCQLYGIDRFDKLNDILNDIWMADVKQNQLQKVLSGLAPVKHLVGIGEGVCNLYFVPTRQYQKDGRLVRSLQKGAVAFAKTTTTELARLGAKVAVGTQNILEGAEGLLSPGTAFGSVGSTHSEDWEDLSGSPPGSKSPPRTFSKYADQPLGVRAGLTGAFRALERDLLTTRDAIIAIPGEVMESDSPGGAAMAVARRAPTIILRPASGAMKAAGMILHGAGNQIDRANHRRINDKYKRH